MKNTKILTKNTTSKATKAAFASALVLGAVLAVSPFTAKAEGLPEGWDAGHPDNGWYEYDGKKYWYEDGVLQGTEGRGKEIYDPSTDAWYWLDSVQGGAVAVSKDVYQPYTIQGQDENGKWVRYDENGGMIKGWNETEKGWYYFDEQTGAMVKGAMVLDGATYVFDSQTGILLTTYDYEAEVNGNLTGWLEVDGKKYWYENGVKQGTEGRGKEIYDPASDAWYWLDSIQNGAMAVSKDVYQPYTIQGQDENGKWVRYDENGRMIKGWDETEEGWYYFDEQTGAMAHGWTPIDEGFDGVYCAGCYYKFDEVTGVLDKTPDLSDCPRGVLVYHYYEPESMEDVSPEHIFDVSDFF